MLFIRSRRTATSGFFSTAGILRVSHGVGSRGMQYVKFLILAIMIWSAAGEAERAWAQRKIHPRNQMLISKGLAPKEILQYFPDVPKITANEALSLYRSKKGVFIGVGVDVPRLPDGWILKEYTAFDPRKLSKYKIPIQGTIIVLYCG